MGPDWYTSRRNTLVIRLLILCRLRHGHVVRGGILSIIALNSIGASQHIGTVWELIEHGIHVGLANWHTRVAQLGLSYRGAIAEIEVLEGSSKVIHSGICVFGMQVRDRTWSKCLTGESGVHVAIHVLARSQRLTRECGGQIAIVCTCMIRTSKHEIFLGAVYG